MTSTARKRTDCYFAKCPSVWCFHRRGLRLDKPQKCCALINILHLGLGDIRVFTAGALASIPWWGLFLLGFLPYTLCLSSCHPLGGEQLSWGATLRLLQILLLVNLVLTDSGIQPVSGLLDDGSLCPSLLLHGFIAILLWERATTSPCPRLTSTWTHGCLVHSEAYNPSPGLLAWLWNCSHVGH